MPDVLFSSPHPNPWYRQFPTEEPVWGDWRFHFASDLDRPYDYLVAFDDLAAPVKPRCPLSHRLHVSSEPPSILQYHPRFLAQFGSVITQDVDCDHPNRLAMQPGMNWYLGWNPAHGDGPGALSFQDIANLFDKPRTRNLSIITSNKTFTEGHRRRLAFAQGIKDSLGEEIDLFGRGFRSMDDKLESLEYFRFQIVIENSSYDDYFTEKIIDCILAGVYPIYYGCPNLEKYLPAGSFVRIDIGDVEGSLAVIRNALEQRFDVIHREKLREARDLLMHKHNMFPMLADLLPKLAGEAKANRPDDALFRGQMLPFRSRQFEAATGQLGSMINRRARNLLRKSKIAHQLLAFYRRVRR